MGRHAIWTPISSSSTSYTIRDIGDHRYHLTITNDAEWVVEQLHLSKELGNRRLYYYDSNMEETELVHDGQGKLLRFA